jgi:hypothetical protein
MRIVGIDFGNNIENIISKYDSKIRNIFINDKYDVFDYFEKVFTEDEKEYNDSICISSVRASKFSDAEQVITIESKNESFSDKLFNCNGFITIAKNINPEIRFRLKDNNTKKPHWLADYFKNTNTLIVPYEAMRNNLLTPIYKNIIKILIENKFVSKRERPAKKENNISMLMTNVTNFYANGKRILGDNPNGLDIISTNSNNKETFIGILGNAWGDNCIIKTGIKNSSNEIIETLSKLTKNIFDKNITIPLKKTNYARACYYVNNKSPYSNIYSLDILISYFLGSILKRNGLRPIITNYENYTHNIYIPNILFESKEITKIIFDILFSILYKYNNSYSFETNDTHLFARPEEFSQLGIDINSVKLLHKFIKSAKNNISNEIDMAKAWMNEEKDALSIKVEANTVKTIVKNNIPVIEKTNIIFNEGDIFSSDVKEVLTSSVNAVMNKKYKTIKFYGFKKSRGNIVSEIQMPAGSGFTTVSNINGYMSSTNAICIGLPYSVRNDGNFLDIITENIKTVITKEEV